MSQLGYYETGPFSSAIRWNGRDGPGNVEGGGPSAARWVRGRQTLLGEVFMTSIFLLQGRAEVEQGGREEK